MFHKRIVALLLLIAVVAVPIGAGQHVQAQDGAGAVFCGQLSADDCAILTGSQEAMASITSAAIDAEASITISGFEITDGVDELTFSLSANGDAESDLTALYDMQAGMPTDIAGMAEMMEDPEALMEMVLESFSLIESLVDESKANLTLELASVPVLEDGLEVITVELRMTDGVLYVKQQPLADQLDLPDPVDAEWAAVDFGTALDEALAEAMSELDMSELEGAEITDEDIATLASIMNNELVTLFSDAEFLNEFVTVTRLDDAELDGQTMAVFESTVDLRDMLLSSTFSDAVFSFLEEMQELDPEAASDLGFTPSELQLVLTLAGSMLSSAEFTTVQWIGVDDLYVYHTEGTMDFQVNLSLLAGGDSSVPESISLTGDLRVDVSNINEPVEVTVPDDVEFYDLEDLE